MTPPGGNLTGYRTAYSISSTFYGLFNHKPQIVSALRDDMAKRGYDDNFPIILADGDWTDNVVLIDGHHRAEAALSLGIEPKFVLKKFDSEDDALDYVIHIQRDRRNLTDVEIARCIATLDKVKTAGRPSKELASTEVHLFKGKSAEATAKKLGTSRTKVEKARAVMSDSTPTELKEAVKSGEKSINQAYNEIRGKKKVIADEVADEIISVPINNLLKLTEIIRENYSPDHVLMLIDMLQRRMAA